jgi:hypothetical protein
MDDRARRTTVVVVVVVVVPSCVVCVFAVLRETKKNKVRHKSAKAFWHSRRRRVSAKHGGGKRLEDLIGPKKRRIRFDS